MIILQSRLLIYGKRPWDCFGYSKKCNFAAPLTAVALQQFVSAAGSGLGNEDDAAVAKIYARNAGIQLPQNKT